MAGDLETEFEEWRLSLENSEQYTWLQSTKDTADILFMGFDIHISDLDINDFSRCRFLAKDKSQELWVSRLNTDFSNQTTESFHDLLTLASTYYKNRNATITSTTITTIKISKTDDDVMFDYEEGDEDGEQDFEDEEDDQQYESDEQEEPRNQYEAVYQVKEEVEQAKTVPFDEDQDEQEDCEQKNDHKQEVEIDVVSILTKELYSIRNGHSLVFTAEPINDNIYFWNVKMFGFEQSTKISQQLQMVKKEFNYDYVELQVFFTNLYPFYPPTLKIIRPRLQGFLIGKIPNLEILSLEHWDQYYGMVVVLNQLKVALEKDAQLDVDNQLNSLTNTSSYSSIEHYLLHLELLLRKINGVDKESERKIISLLSDIEKEIKTNPHGSIYNTLKESCLTSFFEGYFRAYNINHQILLYMDSIRDALASNGYAALLSLLPFKTTNALKKPTKKSKSTTTKVEQDENLSQSFSKETNLPKNLVMVEEEWIDQLFFFGESEALTTFLATTSLPYDGALEAEYVDIIVCIIRVAVCNINSRLIHGKLLVFREYSLSSTTNHGKVDIAVVYKYEKYQFIVLVVEVKQPKTLRVGNSRSQFVAELGAALYENSIHDIHFRRELFESNLNSYGMLDCSESECEEDCPKKIVIEGAAEYMTVIPETYGILTSYETTLFAYQEENKITFTPWMELPEYILDVVFTLITDWTKRMELNIDSL